MPEALTVELTLAGVTASIPEARRFARATLQSWELHLVVDAAALIVSELATNAVLHARSSFTVRLALDGQGKLLVEVVDGSVRPPQAKPHGAGATTGRGLSIVEELADEWGVEPRPDGKAVWVRLDAVAVGERGGERRAGTDRRADGGGRRLPGPDGTQVRAA